MHTTSISSVQTLEETLRKGTIQSGRGEHPTESARVLPGGGRPEPEPEPEPEVAGGPACGSRSRTHGARGSPHAELRSLESRRVVGMGAAASCSEGSKATTVVDGDASVLERAGRVLLAREGVAASLRSKIARCV